MILGFGQIKEVLLAGFGLSRDAMHIHIGLALYFALHLPFRARLGDWRPLFFLFVLVMTGEVIDNYLIVQSGEPILWLESAKDAWNTMFWPTLFTVYGRWGRSIG